MIFTYKIADVVFSVDIRFKKTYDLMTEYLAEENEKPDFTIKTTDEDIAKERELSPHNVADYCYEFTSVYRKFIYQLMENYDAFFFHCSSIAVDNQAILFTAQSGTGKSTHRNLWLKAFKDKITVINDDKPVIRKIDEVYYVYGTPWKGKEGMGNNIRVPAKALCFLSRSEENHIGKIDSMSAVTKALNQTIRPQEPQLMSNLLNLLDGFLKQVDTFDLRVNMNEDAAIVAYNGIMSAQTNKDT